ncbi:hypothetical protein Q6U55_004388, partial [Vibrio vulnificus]|nr:hypothetical protein [Vibrio vulnificus]
KLSQSEVEYFAALGQRLSNHLPIYTSMLTSTYSVDSNLARVWTEIVFSMESLASILIEFEKDLTESTDQFEIDGLIYTTRHRIGEYFGKLLAFKQYEAVRRSQVT